MKSSPKQIPHDKIAKYIISHPKLSNAKIAEKFGTSTATVWRIRENTRKVKFSNKNVQNKNVVTWEGFEGVKEEVVDKKTQKRSFRITHGAGPIRGKRSTFIPNIFGDASIYDEDTINHWTPHMQLTVNDEKTGKPLSAAEITYRRNKNQKWTPTIFSNPAQSLDYITFEAHSRSTIGGPMLRTLVQFIYGRGVTPELELINPSEDSMANQKEIDENQDIIRDLKQIENQLSFDVEGDLDISFQEKLSSLTLNALTFNRSALINRYDHPVIIDGKSYGDIPSSMMNAHARDLGMIKTDPITSRLKGFMWNNAGGFIDVNDSTYLWNPLISANTRNSMYYGDSMMVPMIDALRTIRTNIGVNFTAMGENAYSGLGLLSIAPEGQTDSEKESEYTDISERMVPATTNIVFKDPKDTRFDNINYDPKVDQFINMNESLVKYCAASLGMPHAMFYDESASNRATMIGKIQLATSTVINPLRQWINRSVSPQTYDKWFRIMNKDDEELLKKFKIVMRFEDLHISEWYDNVEGALELDSRKKMTDDQFGKLVGLDNYPGMVDSDAETIPGGSGSRKMTIGSGTERITMKKSNL